MLLRLWQAWCRDPSLESLFHPITKKLFPNVQPGLLMMQLHSDSLCLTEKEICISLCAASLQEVVDWNGVTTQPYPCWISQVTSAAPCKVLPSRPFSTLVTFLWTCCAHVHCVKPCLLKHILETVMFIIPCKCWNRGDEVNGFRDYRQNFPTLLHAVKSWVTVMIIVKVSLPLLEGSSDMPLRAMCRENFTTFPLYLWKASRCFLGFCQLLVYVPFIPENIYFPFSLY